MKKNRQLTTFIILVLLIFCYQNAIAYAYTAEQKSALRRVNYWRKALGLKPASLDPALSQAAMAHSRYVYLNEGNPNAFLDWPFMHLEKQGYSGFTGKNPYERAKHFGYSPHGENNEVYAGVGEVLSLDGFFTNIEVDEFLNTLYHMKPLLYYGLDFIGYGAAGQLGDLTSTINTAENTYAQKPDAFFKLPFPGQMNTNLFLTDEMPDPLEDIGIKDSTYGPAIVFHHNDIYYDDEENPTGSKLVVKSATLIAGGKTVPVYYWNPMRRNLPFKDQVVLFPKDPLKYSTKYTVKISGTVKGKAFTDSWNFYTPLYNMTKDLSAGSPIDVSVNISKLGWTKTSNNVVIVPVEKYMEAPIATPLAKKLGAPILVTHKDYIPTQILNELKRLKPKKITVVGSTLDGINNKLKKKGYITEYIGYQNPFYLSKALAKRVGTNTNKEAFLARKWYFNQAIAAAPHAAQRGAPLMYVNKDDVPKPISAAIDELGIKKVYIMGTTEVISYKVEKALKAKGIKVVRIPERYAPGLSVRLAGYFSRAEIPQSRIWVVANNNTANILSVGALASRPKATILFSGSDTIPRGVQKFISYRKPTIGKAFTIGLNWFAKSLINSPRVSIK